MTASGSSTLGDVQNKGSDDVIVQVWPVAASTAITKGKLVYLDGTNGAKVAPTTGAVYASRIFFAGTDADNTNGSAGDVSVTVYGPNAIVIGKAQGNIAVGRLCQASETTAGSFMEWAEPADESATATFSSVSINANKVANLKKLAIYLGHAGEGLEIGNAPTAATDAQTTCKLDRKSVV